MVSPFLAPSHDNSLLSMASVSFCPFKLVLFVLFVFRSVLPVQLPAAAAAAAVYGSCAPAVWTCPVLIGWQHSDVTANSPITSNHSSNILEPSSRSSYDRHHNNCFQTINLTYYCRYLSINLSLFCYRNLAF
jgi:hypothetical protein